MTTSNTVSTPTIPVYASFEEKEKHFNIKYIDTIEDFRALKADSIQPGNGVFRGIHSGTYKIFTSLQRYMLLGEISEKYNIDKYIETFRNDPTIKRNFKTFNLPTSKLSMLSFLQHYGSPTPLLDFTNSFEVATYFATDPLVSKPYMEDDNPIQNYFTIFNIPEQYLPLIDVKPVFKDLQKFKEQYLDTLGKQEENEKLYRDHMDTMMGMNTMEVYLVDFKNIFASFNVQNSIRILNQEGLFIHNSLGIKPFEEALKEFFIPATKFVGSALDDIDLPGIEEQNEEYRQNLKKNTESQAILAKNIITSYEIHKSLVPEILKEATIDGSIIYPDFGALGKKAFAAAR